MLARILSLLLIALPAIATAADPIVLPSLADGTYVLTVAGGKVTLAKATVVVPTISPVPTPTPNPTPDPDPTPAPLSTRAKAIQAAALAVTGDPDREATAANLAEMYRLISGKVTAGTFKGQAQIATAVQQLTKMLLTERKTVQAWAPVQTLIGEHWDALVQEGATDPQYAAYLVDAANGLDASAPDRQQIDIAFLMQILEFFIKYILPLIIK